MKTLRRVVAVAPSSTANLGHGFDVFGVALDIAFDRVIAERASRNEIILQGPLSDGIDTRFGHNCAGRAVQRLLKSPVRLTLIKGIPPGSGLGSSSASAVAAVTAVDRLFNLGMSLEERVAHAAEGERASAGAAHADNVAASTVGGFTIATKEGSLRIFSYGIPRAIIFCVALPNCQVTTRQARSILPDRISLAASSRAVARGALTALALTRGDARLLGWAIEDAFADGMRRNLVPHFGEVARAARKAGALGVSLSGSGPAILAVVPSVAVGKRVARAMERAAGRAWIARPTRGARVVEVRR